MVDLTTFQQLDSIFVNVREVPVIECVLCNKHNMNWVTFTRHISEFQPEYRQGFSILTWPEGIDSEEHVHGAAQFLTPSLQDIRAAFTFR